jgi:glycosidase
MDHVFEFHVSRAARRTYQFDETLFSTDGRVIFSNFSAARRFSDRIYAVSGRTVPASDIYAMGLIDEVLHLVIRQYERQNPAVMARAFEALQSKLGARLQETLNRFLDAFPPMPVYHGQQSVKEYLSTSTAEKANKEVAIEEMLLLSIANNNPAMHPYKELFDDAVLAASAYPDAIVLMRDFLAGQPAIDKVSGQTLYEILVAPIKASPNSLEGQLQFLLERWGTILGPEILQRLLRGIDFVREEVMRQSAHGDFPVVTYLPDYHGEPEYERYSQDREWMSRLVLMAKNTYVWLEQLSRKYQRWIKTLDQIPDEELELLASRGFTGLWMIGLWERSRASQRIKERMGQGEAVASAYSLFSYDIASDLGGWGALENFRARASRFGIRLSADMVANHMGIDSTWVIEHPDWFLSSGEPPYPSYQFSSENLGDDSRVEIILEDHYYSKTDASVVFKRLDKWTGDPRYIYHGNDGTSFPWNDTAQLDYSKPEVREAVIQTILHVARNFPIIRFDAAMTLAKKHIQRLWFPEPGAGGTIASRAEHGMTKTEFDAAIPQEFWREVVDRVATEAPDTLLLAEAFWLMEGYFVRTLGMHRVYNSAFMHMLRDEDNAKYRQAIKNTLEFDPQILKRYVNFMTNPDEKTAIEQFGDGDKYFGVATLLSTLPGLPMFGHGQIEGYREKYGMEFRKPNWDETANEGLIRGHEWKIFPLLHHRYLFANVEQFLLYDFYRSNGRVDENIFAYSNLHGDQRALVIYNNKYADSRGWIRTSAAYLDKSTGKLVQKSLGEGLRLPQDGYVIFKDYATHMEYIRACSELNEKGMYVELGAYQCHVFMDWRFVTDVRWQKVYDSLQGTAVQSIDGKWQEIFAPPVGVPVDEPGPKKTRRKASPKKMKTTKKTPGVKKSTARKPAKVTAKSPDPKRASKKSKVAGTPWVKTTNLVKPEASRTGKSPKSTKPASKRSTRKRSLKSK